MARLPFVDKATAPDEVRAMFTRMEEAAVPVFGRRLLLNVMRVLAHAPAVLRRVASLGNVMLSELSLDPKLRELAVLQLFRITGCDYGFQQHVAIAKAAGLSDKQIANVGAYRTYAYYTEVERLVLEYAEVVTRDVAVPDALFARARAQFSDRELVELTMVIAYWNMMSRVLVPLAVELEGND